MKKKIFTFLMLMFISAIGMVACNSGPSVSGEFSKNEYIISVGEIMNFYDCLTLTGAEKDGIEFSSSNPDIIDFEEEGNLKGKVSGQTYLFANFNDEIIAQTKIYVKYQQAVPKNLTLDDSGRYSWDKSFVVIDGVESFAPKYEVAYAKLDGGDLSDIEYTFEETENNYFDFETGTYSVKVRAMAESDYIDNSEFSTARIVNVGVKGFIENLQIRQQGSYNNQVGEVTWREKPEATYDVFIQGFKMFTDLTESSFTFDFAIYKNLTHINISIVAKDINEKVLPTTTMFIFQKLDSPRVDYVYENGDGYITINQNDALGFRLQSTAFAGGVTEVVDYTIDEAGKLNLNDKLEGFYNIEVISLGGVGRGGLFLNSDPSDYMTIYKLAMPKVDVVLDQTHATLTFAESDYVENYKIEWGNKSLVYNINDGYETKIDLTDLTEGDYTFKITAIPTFIDNDIKEYKSGDISTKSILNSDAFTFDFVITNKIENIRHEIRGDVSTIIFDRIHDDAYYLLYINGEPVSVNNNFSVLDNGRQIVMELKGLKNYASKNDKYELKVVAGILNESGKEKALIRECSTTLTILPIVTKAEDQINGSFAWNSLDEDVIYKYEIFQADKNYNYDATSIVASGNTEEDSIAETLDEGYYVIKVTTISKDTSVFLDSNFERENNIFTNNFFVTKQIETPSAVFVNENGEYKLIIDTRQFGGEYRVYVDGKLEGKEVLSQMKDKIEYVLAETFNVAKSYEVKVVAYGGLLYDENIYRNSEDFNLYVNRLASPTFSVEEVYNVFNEKTNEIFTVNMIDNVDYPIILLDGERLNNEGEQSIDIFDYNIFDTEFNISLQFIASESNGNNYYLDSQAATTQFKRVGEPTSINYSNGLLRYSNTDNENVENYFITLTIVTRSGEENAYRFFTTDNSLNFNLQAMIDERREIDLAFDTAYRKLSYLKVEVSAKKNGYVEEIYYLPSVKGTTSSGENVLSIYKLSAPAITFNSQTREVEWESVEPGSTYDIYVDGLRVKRGYASTSISLPSLNNNWLRARTVYVRSNNNAYLTSDDSNSISIKQLNKIDNVNISKTNGQWVVSLPLKSDISSIKEILVNGSTENVNFAQGGNVASFKLADFEGINLFRFKVVAKNDSEINYYFDSDETTFDISDIKNKSLIASLGGNTISWNSVSSDIVGASSNPVLYSVYVQNNGEIYSFDTTNNSFSIQELENLINVKLLSDADIYVVAKINEDYSLTLVNNSAKGYYGEVESSVVNVKKLSSVSSVEASVITSEAETYLERYLNASVMLSWENLWSSFDNVQFNIVLTYEDESSKTLVFEENVLHEDYSFNLEDGTYKLTLNKALVKAGVNTLSITVIKIGAITSETFIDTFDRYHDLTDSKISDAGVLSILDEQNASYLFKLEISGYVKEKEIIADSDDFATQINLMTEEYLRGKYGKYTVSIIAYDKNGKVAPSTNAFIIEGYKLEGIDNIYIEEQGNIVFSLILDEFTDLEWTARIEKDGDKITRLFTPTQIENEEGGLENKFIIAMIDVVDLFKDDLSMRAEKLTFDFTVRKASSVDADWESISFNYAIDSKAEQKRGDDFTKDYLIFAKGENDNTIYFRTIITAQDETKIVKYFSADETLGYWVENEDKTETYFNRLKDDREGFTYTECYGVVINEILSDYPYGEFSFEISRIGKTDNEYYQYNKQNFSVYKLNKITDEFIEGDVNQTILQINSNSLVWTWMLRDEMADESIKPTAYYLIFKDTTADTTTQLLTYKTNVDLRTVGLVPGNNYEITVTAVSSDRNIISSDQSLAFTTLRYTTPLNLDVKDGKLVFDEEIFKNSQFIQILKDYFGQKNPETPLYELLDKQFTEPVYFSPNSLANVTLNLRFTAIKDGAVTNTSYNMSVFAYELFPDFEIQYFLNDMESPYRSYIDLLDEYNVYFLTGMSGQLIENTKSMINCLVAGNRGIGDNQILFDDYGRNIPAGEYQVSVVQVGSRLDVESERSSNCRIYLAASPEYTLQTEKVDLKEQYTINVYPTIIQTSDEYDENGNPLSIIQTTATKYKMVLRTYESGGKIGKYIELIISYDGSQWQIEYKGKLLESVISSIESNQDIPGFKINLTSLKDELNYFDSEESLELITVNQSIKVDIFAYSGANQYLINGKSAIINVNYLDLREDSMSFIDGQFEIRAEALGDNYEVLVRYKREGLAEDSYSVRFKDGVAVITLEKNSEDKYSGIYNYIILSIKGSINANSINIESDTYGIRNLYKLREPGLITQNNNLVISYNPADINYMSTLKFRMANNESLKEDYDGADHGYYFNSNLYRDNNGFVYVAGDIDGDTVYPSELIATNFTAYLNGNSGTFTLSDVVYERADHLLVFSESRPIFTSTQASIDAKMLPSVEAISISNGDVVWKAPEEISEVVSANGEEGKLVYKVDVSYYSRFIENSGYATFAFQREQTYYTTDTILKTDYISTNYDYYKISVTMLAGTPSTQADTNAKPTLQNEYYNFYNAMYYNESNLQVLRSQAITNESYYERTESPFLDDGSTGILNGDIIFVINRNLYQNDSVTSGRLSVVAEYDYQGQSYKVPLTGKFTFTYYSEIGKENYEYVSFTPDEGQLNGIGAFNINIYIYKDNALNSKPLTLANVYKLALVDESKYKLGLEYEQTVLDLSNYFRTVQFYDDNTCYKIQVEFIRILENGRENIVKVEDLTVGTTTSVVLDSDYLKENEITKIRLRAIDNQDLEQLNPKLLLYSDNREFLLNYTNVEGLEISWNAQEMRFEWAWNSDNDNSYEFDVNLLVGGKTEKALINEYYYAPQNRGNIASGNFSLRARLLDTSENIETLYLFSNQVIYQGNDISLTIFSGGNGSEEDPYIIRTVEDFLNISKRNNEKNSYYFALGADLTISDSDLFTTDEIGNTIHKIETFYGTLDGKKNNYTLTYVSNLTYNMESYSANITGVGVNNTCNFDLYSSIFNTLASGAKIQNLAINYRIDYRGLNKSNILFAPVALNNYGSVENVDLRIFEISNLSGSDANNVFVGGLVSLNYGNITNCSNTASFNYTIAQRLNLNFGYSGISIFNISSRGNVGTITNCFNSGDKSVVLRLSNNVIYGSGITLVNSGRITLSGNDGNFTVSCDRNVTAFTAYLTGIALSSSGGTLEYLYNNGTLALDSSIEKIGRLNASGIVYTLSSGTINTLVEASGLALVNTCGTRPTDRGTNYVGSGSNTASAIRTQLISARVIACGNTGYNLQIVSSSDGFRALIVKA